MKSNTLFMVFHVAQVKYVDFLHRASAAVHAYVSSRPRGFHLV